MATASWRELNATSRSQVYLAEDTLASPENKVVIKPLAELQR